MTPIGVEAPRRFTIEGPTVVAYASGGFGAARALREKCGRRRLDADDRSLDDAKREAEPGATLSLARTDCEYRTQNRDGCGSIVLGRWLRGVRGQAAFTASLSRKLGRYRIATLPGGNGPPALLPSLDGKPRVF